MCAQQGYFVLITTLEAQDNLKVGNAATPADICVESMKVGGCGLMTEPGAVCRRRAGPRVIS